MANMSSKNNIMIFLAGGYLVFSFLFLLYLLSSPDTTSIPTLFLFILLIPSISMFFSNIKEKKEFSENLLLMVFFIYVLELPPFLFALNPVWRARLVMAHVSQDYTIYFSFLALLFSMMYVISENISSGKKAFSNILRPSVSDENRIAFGISMFFFIIGSALLLLSFRATDGGIAAIFQLILYTYFAYILVGVYLKEGLHSALLLSASFVSTLIYFEFSGIYRVPEYETLWILPFVIGGLWVLVDRLKELRRASSASTIKKEILHLK